jgi:hypothetical protein
VITDVVIDEATDEVAVVYEQQHTKLRFVRLAKIFIQEVLYTSGEYGPRFIRYQ